MLDCLNNLASNKLFYENEVVKIYEFGNFYNFTFKNNITITKIVFTIEEVNIISEHICLLSSILNSSAIENLTVHISKNSISLNPNFMNRKIYGSNIVIPKKTI